MARKYAAKADRNQPEIVAALRKAGASVELLHRVGGGCPDLMVGFRGKNFLIEVKDWKAANADRELNPNQVEWHRAWNGQAAKAETIDAALIIIGAKLVPFGGQIR